MRIVASLLLGSLALAGGVPVAAAQAATPETEPFDAKLMVVRADRALDFWYRTAESTGPHFALVSRVHPNDCVLLLTMFKGVHDTGGGKAKVTVTISTIDPAGTTEVLAQDIPAWDDRMPSKDVILMSRAIPEFYLDDKEPLGTTTIVVEARDEGSAQVSRCESKLELVPWSYGDVPDSDSSADAWIEEYYRAPKPGEAVRAYLEYARLESKGGKTINYGTLGFFRTVFQESPWLVDHLASRFDPADREQGKKLVVMLHLLGQDERIQKLAFPDGKVHGMPGELAKIELPDPYSGNPGTQKLDLLWGEFLATGRYKPVRQIISALALAEFEADVEGYSKSKKTDKDRERLAKGATFMAARWSLGSNMKQHPLVLDYARWAAEHEKLGQVERKQLEMLLEKGR